MPLRLDAPGHTVPYGTVPFQGTLSQALRARLTIGVSLRDALSAILRQL